MKLLVTGVCGFAGSEIALDLLRRIEGLEIHGVDNLSRPGSELNRRRLRAAGVRVHHGDIRLASDIESLPAVDWVIDAAANPSVLAGVTGVASSRQLMEHNLVGTIQVLEYCKRYHAGLVMLSTSRVYSVTHLSSLPLEVTGIRFSPSTTALSCTGMSAEGISEDFPSESPLSLYGAAKRASEVIILDYSSAFDFPAHVNRCGMLAGAGQFGKPDQGIFSYWLQTFRWKLPPGTSGSEALDTRFAIAFTHTISQR